MTSDYLLFALIGACVMCLITCSVMWLRITSQKKQITEQKSDLTTLLASIRKIQTGLKQQDEKIHEVRTGLYGVSDKVAGLDKAFQQQQHEIDNKVAQTTDKLKELESADPGARLYTKAAKLVASGATVEEIMQECDLPRAEAELLLNLHSK